MKYYSKRFTVYYYPGHWIQYQSCTQSAPSQLRGEHSGQAVFSEALTCQIKRQITFASYRVPIYTPGLRAAMWIKCLAEGKKVPSNAWAGSNSGHKRGSQVSTLIYCRHRANLLLIGLIILYFFNTPLMPDSTLYERFLNNINVN